MLPFKSVLYIVSRTTNVCISIQFFYAQTANIAIKFTERHIKNLNGTKLVYEDDNKAIYVLSTNDYILQSEYDDTEVFLYYNSDKLYKMGRLELEIFLRQLKNIHIDFYQGFMDYWLNTGELEDLSELYFVEDTIMELKSDYTLKLDMKFEKATVQVIRNEVLDKEATYFKNKTLYYSGEKYYLLEDFDKGGLFSFITSERYAKLRDLASYCYETDVSLRYMIVLALTYFIAYETMVNLINGVSIRIKDFVYDDKMEYKQFNIMDVEFDCYRYKNFWVTKDGYVKLLGLYGEKLDWYLEDSTKTRDVLNDKQKEKLKKDLSKFILIKKPVQLIANITDELELIDLEVIQSKG